MQTGFGFDINNKKVDKKYSHLRTYPFGKISFRRLSVYHVETAGNPNNPIPVTRNNVSKTANKIKRFTKEAERLMPFRFFTKKQIL